MPLHLPLGLSDLLQMWLHASSHPSIIATRGAAPLSASIASTLHSATITLGATGYTTPSSAHTLCASQPAIAPTIVTPAPYHPSTGSSPDGPTSDLAAPRATARPATRTTDASSTLPAGHHRATQHWKRAAGSVGGSGGGWPVSFGHLRLHPRWRER